MTDLLDTPPNTPDELPNDDSMLLADYAQRAYLEYALSVVKGRALPDACDGQKPVQRRILYSMARMGLSFGGANGATGAKPVKSARVVGDVLGRFHPHSDQAAYDALVQNTNSDPKKPLMTEQDIPSPEEMTAELEALLRNANPDLP